MTTDNATGGVNLANNDENYTAQFGTACNSDDVKFHITFDINLYTPINTGEEQEEEEQNQLTNAGVPQCIWEDYNYVHPVRGQKTFFNGWYICPNLFHQCHVHL